MNNPALFVQVLECFCNLFDNNLSHRFLDSQLTTLVIIAAKEASEVSPVAVLEDKVIVIFCPILSIHLNYTLMLHFRENQRFIKNII
jgi:hypothetical protein